MRMKIAAFLACLGFPLLLAAQSGAAGATFGVGGMAGLEGAGHASHPVATGMPNVCPVGLHARYMADGTTIKTARVRVRGIGQRLYLTLTRPDARKIAGATVVVEGWPPESRLQEARMGAAKHQVKQAQRKLAVALTAESDTTASGELWAPGLASVDAVELVSLQYRDGSKWSPAAGVSCRIAPDGTMLISQP